MLGNWSLITGRHHKAILFFISYLFNTTLSYSSLKSCFTRNNQCELTTTSRKALSFAVTCLLIFSLLINNSLEPMSWCHVHSVEPESEPHFKYQWLWSWRQNLSSIPLFWFKVEPVETWIFSRTRVGAQSLGINDSGAGVGIWLNFHLLPSCAGHWFIL